MDCNIGGSCPFLAQENVEPVVKDRLKDDFGRVGIYIQRRLERS